VTTPPLSRAALLRQHLAQDRCHLIPSCFDGLSAKMIGDAGVPFTFMSGFAVSATRLGAPDLGLISYGEMVDATSARQRRSP
jgi:2-methylisocitrate lyase-like PEP mutase family enzyme